jgi:uncharacterized 2Fe-2S/4Fe-4S cluster protein (DUF4445 family)
MKLTFLPEQRTIDFSPEQTILEAARQLGVDIVATCGGRGRCNSCRIQVIDGTFTPPTDQETKILGVKGLQHGFRLACQTKVLEDGTVRIVPPISERRFRILSKTERRDYAIEPAVHKQYISVPTTSEEQQSSDVEEIQKLVVTSTPSTTAHDGMPQIDLHALQQLPTTIFKASRNITTVMWEQNVIGIEAGDTTAAVYGVAFDIGTTTVVGYLLDLRTGKEVAVASELNAQALYGGDLMSRISFAQEDATGLRQLHDRILHTVNRIIDSLCEQAGIDCQNIYEITVVGNPCMHHLFLNISPVHLGLAPYLAAIRQRYVTKASELGIHMSPGGKVSVLPLIAGFVGADTVGVIVATGLHKSQDIKLAVDIGTNGEIVLGKRDRMMACSTAAGTAFEGAQITYGMRGASGAIDKVTIDSEVHIHVIGEGLAQGICGSGLVDAIAQMLDAEILASTGRLRKQAELEKLGVPPALRKRIVEQNRQRAFILATEEESDTGEPVVITQQDIRELQLAKGAIFAGIAMLVKALDIQMSDITELLLAGAFGNYLDPRSAVRIGLIPAFPLEKIRSVGNAAGLGSQLALLSRKAKFEADSIAAATEHLALTHNPEFQMVFAESMGFPKNL